ncbi:transglutaminaseTgpA domain-containing protein [Nonomuraea sp. AD125B]|uniref:transglutaminaseTgpA domain-containing protein n=1 Tax=Nonomuraea sp. AD125B TaxID=3242897 RepID=UPI003528E350
MRLTVASGAATFTAAILLYPLFEGGTWFWSSLGAVLAVMAAGLVSSRLSLPAWAAPVLALAVTGIYLTVSFAAEEAWGLVVPTKASVLELGRLLGVGWADIQRFAAPVPDTEGIVLLTTGGVALIAILVDLFAARLRRAALAGLPLLALATVPATILPDPISWPAFIIAAFGFVGLLVADGRERIGHWGRAVLVRRTRMAATPSQGAPGRTGAPARQTARQTAAADTSGLRLSGKRIGFAAIALAVLVPALLPAMEPVSFFQFGVGGSGTGGRGNSISIPNPIAGLRGQLELPERRIVLTYASNDNQPRYLRIYALDTFDGQQFGMTKPKGAVANRTDNGPLPEPPGLTGRTDVTNVTTDIEISDQVAELMFLPLPYPPREIQVDGDWRADVDTLMVFSTRDEAAGLGYRVLTSEPAPTRELLESLPFDRDAVDPRFLALPEDLPAEIRALPRRIVGEVSSPYEAAVKLQKWFTEDGGFTYNLRTQGHSTSALADFLLHSRTGYCEQFAASMAVLARLMGIPARVAIGYTGGSVVGGRWQVGTNDSHSWPELYFEGVGWLPFEPTPSGSLGQGSARPPAYSVPAPESTGDSSTPTPGATSSAGSDEIAPGSQQNPRAVDRESQLLPGGAPAPEESSPVIGKVALGLAGLLLVLLIPAAARVVTRNRRIRALDRQPAQPSDGVTARATAGRAPSVTAAWAELDDVLYDYGLARHASETPRALARRLVQQYEFGADAAAALSAIASAVERVLFARDPGRTGPLRKELRTVRQAIAATVSRRRRIRAVLLPPSTLRRLRGFGERLLDGFDLLETIRLRRTAAEKGS